MAADGKASLASLARTNKENIVESIPNVLKINVHIKANHLTLFSRS